jgi:hypothetical protein
LREAEGDVEIWRRGFVRAGNAFEAIVQNGSPQTVTRGFFRVIGAASYHLAGYSALAFSMIAQRPVAANLAPAEEALVFLMLRDLNQLSTRTWLTDPAHSDEAISCSVEAGEIGPDEVVILVVTSTVFRIRVL